MVAAVNGRAIGAGLAPMLADAIIVASNDDWFQMPEVDVGLGGGARCVMEHLQNWRCRAMHFTARRYPAQELCRLGGIEAVTTPEGLMDEGMTHAREMAAKVPVALKAACVDRRPRAFMGR